MPTTITQSYPSETQAREAAAALRKTFRDDLVKMERKSTGKATVTVEAEPDKAMTAIRILNEPGAAARIRTQPACFTTPRPCPDFFDLPVLSNRKPRVTLIDEPAPLSKLLGLPTILKN